MMGLPRISRRTLIKSSLLAAGGVLVASYPFYLEPRWIRIRSVALAPDPTIRIAFLSDFHYSAIVEFDWLSRILEKTIRLNPDLIVSGGDFVTGGDSRYIRDLPALFKPFTQTVPFLSVLGNHDYAIYSYFANRHLDNTHKKVRRGLEKAGIDVLVNESRTFTISERPIQIAGTDDLWSGRIDLSRTFRETDSNITTILLTHNPDLVPRLGKFRPDYVLAGHSHGGQVYIPGIGAPWAPIKYKQFLYGLTNYDGLPVYTTSGIGYLWPGRLFVRPEIVIVEI